MSELLYDFTYLQHLDPSSLLHQLLLTHMELANLHTDVAFIKAEEARGLKDRLPERHKLEGDLRALDEKKWLILKLLEYSHA